MPSSMLDALLHAGRRIGAALHRWRQLAAPRRPMLVELAVLSERLACEKIRADLFAGAAGVPPKEASR